ncbi:MAG: hemolysin family protein [Proteobacteria bacterium]|nr:hemolysin family protein [Pseudomonadota bacterium]MBU1717148.1 hemolysin family protein [Pseudomonadota bacterium]
MLTQLLIAIGLAVFVSALCSIFEAALYSITLPQIELLTESGKKSGPLLKKLKSDITNPITAILTLNTIANTMGAAVAGASAAVVLGDQYLGWFSAAFTLIILLFSEILPKTIGVAYSKQLAPLIARPVDILVKILTPVIWLCKSVTHLVPVRDRDYLISAEEVRAIAILSRKSGEIDRQEEKVITNILALKNKNVLQVMTPRTVTFALSEHITVGESIKMQTEWDRHSRVPVYNEDYDDIVGIVLRKEMLLNAAEGKNDLKLSELIHPAHFVPESAPLSRVLMDFFEKRNHLFIVVDEYGGFTGVISLEDIIEEIVGREIMDETDQTKDMRELARRKRKLLTGQ